MTDADKLERIRSIARDHEAYGLSRHHEMVLDITDVLAEKGEGPEPTTRAQFAVRGRTLSTCTIPDLDVLKELDSIPTNVIEWWRKHGTVHQSNLAVVELKRRGDR
jgi:hypothetical protein